MAITYNKITDKDF